MPWFLKGTCVHKGTKEKDEGVIKCHPNKKAAVDHLRALYRNVEHAAVTEALDAIIDDIPEMVAPTILPTGWTVTPLGADGLPTVTTTGFFTTTNAPTIEGSRVRLFFQEGERTADNRVIDPNAINFNRPPPLPIRLQTAAAQGHDGAVICGVIDKVMRDGHVIVAEGRLDLGSESGREASRLIREGIMATWSPDLGDATVDVEENALDEDGHTPQESLAHFVQATMLGATLCAMPALASAVVELLNDDGSILVPAPTRQGTPEEPAGTSTDPNDIPVITERTDDRFQGGVLPKEVVAHVGDGKPEVFIPSKSGEVVPMPSFTACAGPANPPSSFFANPELSELQRWTTLTPEGRVFGHSADNGTECHIGFLDRCVTTGLVADGIIDGCNFEYAMPGHVLTAEGTKVATGPLAVRGGHASKKLGWREALNHYDDPECVVADVTYGRDEFGIWFSGAIRPTATEDQLYVLRASGVSMDAREIDGKLRYLATCAVNTPGFPKASARLVASAEGDAPRVVTLIAAGGQPEPILSDDCLCCGEDPFDVLLARVSDEPFEALLTRIPTDEEFDKLESRISQ